jgi:hypothetical protein
MKKLLLAAVGILLLLGGTACSYGNPRSDEIGIYYSEGSLDGQKFEKCVPGGESTQTGDMFEEEDAIYGLPGSLRYWKIAREGGDSADPIDVPAKPDEGQPSGTVVNMWPQFAFTINTFCGKDENDRSAAGPQFWERVAQRYYAADMTEDKHEWWPKMISSTIVSAAEALARNIARNYTADVLVSGTKQTEIQQAISDQLGAELKRMTGGDFFCSPAFNRAVPDNCGKVEFLLIRTDYADAGIQAARDEKQKAIEKAAALVAEAQGKVDAANKLASLYNNPNWVALEQAKIELEARKAEADACAKAATCVISGSGVLVGAK